MQTGGRTETATLLAPDALPKILGHAISGGVRTTLLCNRDGAVLSQVRDESMQLDGQNAADSARTFAAAIVANMWTSYEANALGAVRANELHCLLVDCEEGKLAVVKVSPALLLGMLADKDIETGLLRKKILAMQELLLKERIDTLFQ
jgi:predicted regulator of Ras-like GTPase activity (Roadblock/LC7/MglB family)